MKKALDMLIQAIWAQSIKLNQSDPFGAYAVSISLKRKEKKEEFGQFFKIFKVLLCLLEFFNLLELYS